MRITVPLLASLLALPAVAQDPAVPAAAPDAPHGVLTFTIVDESNLTTPGRLTFLDASLKPAKVFSRHREAPERLAMRDHVLYSINGTDRVTVPPGSYRVFASKGLEWSVAEQSLVITQGSEVSLRFALRREVDTTGWVSGDFHLHTLTHSGHGDANLKERVITFLGEGVEFAVATDHNHNTDYHPTMTELGVNDALTAVTGNEVSVPVGHFNAFPLEPDREIPDVNAKDAKVLFRMIRQEPNRYGVTPIIQVNHPRWSTIDYFGRCELDPVTLEAGRDTWSWGFDTVEIFNENEGFGYFDAEVDKVEVSKSKHSVLHEWFKILNSGRRIRAVGNSDSHDVSAELAGYPRNFIRSATDDPGAISVSQIAESIRSGAVFTTIGPFVEFSVNGAPMGGDARAENGAVTAHVRVQAASWIDCDRIKVVVNGDVLQVIPVPQHREVLRFDGTLTIAVTRDCWISLIVEGDDPLAPIVTPQQRPVRPIAVLNPVWVDGDGDGRWTSPRQQGQALMAGADDPMALKRAWAKRGPSERAEALLAAGSSGRAIHRTAITWGLEDRHRITRLAAARAAERSAHKALAPALAVARRRARQDPYADLAMLRAHAACDPDGARAALLALLDEEDQRTLKRYDAEVARLLPGQPVTEWRVCGPYRKANLKVLLDFPFPPETSAELPWRAASADPDTGYLDLLALRTETERLEQCALYCEATVHSPDDREVRAALGTDDGCRMWVNGEVVLEDRGQHDAAPMAHSPRIKLKKGANVIRFKVVNGTGGYGVYLRILDDAVNQHP